MPKLKVGDEELDIDELEAAEYEESDFEPYTGPRPPKGTILTGLIKKAWWCETNSGKRMIKVIFEADDDAGKYAGCPIWDNIALQANTKFRWYPFLEATGITLQDIKRKLYVEDDDDNIGAPIIKIGTWKPGTDVAAIRVVTGSERRNDEWQTKVDKWLEYETPDEDEDDEDEEDEEQDLEEEEEVEEDEEDEEEEPEPPARNRRTAARRARPTATRPAKSAASSRTGAAKPAQSKATATKAAKPPRGRAAKRSGYSDDPPF